ncbi:MAG: hypothetical protein Satyrvirus5_12 [Satyrvirus sp.]|uniref:Uncharacterized protein n=1 Tax=Satyrvirus sp. TaxID=2487771 RepID=A0A3G5ADB0_9VIRU|nr:MAG: hypothetical protein Satyrvirus5_12 [Satyrvirus sp.]
MKTISVLRKYMKMCTFSYIFQIGSMHYFVIRKIEK